MRRATVVDGLAILAVILFLMGIDLLPKSQTTTFVLNRDSPTVLAIVGNSFIHATFWGHLVPNLEAYFLITLAMYIVLRSLGRRRLFYEIFLVNLFIMPTLISITWIPVDELIRTLPGTELGFSDIDASLMGGLLVSLLLLLKRTFGARVDYGIPTLISFRGFLFTYQYGPSAGASDFVLSGVVLVLFAYFFLVFYRSGNQEYPTEASQSMSTAGRLLIFLLPLGCLVILAALFYPTVVIIDGYETNVIIHYIGLVFGILAAFFLAESESNLPTPPALVTNR